MFIRSTLLFVSTFLLLVISAPVRSHAAEQHQDRILKKKNKVPKASKAPKSSKAPKAPKASKGAASSGKGKGALVSAAPSVTPSVTPTSGDICRSEYESECGVGGAFTCDCVYGYLSTFRSCCNIFGTISNLCMAAAADTSLIACRR